MTDKHSRFCLTRCRHIARTVLYAVLGFAGSFPARPHHIQGAAPPTPHRDRVEREIDSFLLSSPPIVPQITLDERGRLSVRLAVSDAPIAGSIGSTELLDHLADPHICNELDLSVETSADLKTWIAQRRADLTRVLRQVHRATPSGTSGLKGAPPAFAALRELDRQFTSDVHQVLTSEESKRLDQLRVRHRVVSAGLVAALRTSRHLRQLLLLSSSDVDRLADAIPKWRAHVTEQTQRTYRESLEQTLRTLTPAQRSQLRERNLLAPINRTPAIEHFLWQTRFAQRKRQSYSHPADEFNTAVLFVVTPCGQFSSRPGDGTGHLLELVSRTGRIDLQMDQVRDFTDALRTSKNGREDKAVVARIVADFRTGRATLDDFRSGFERLNKRSWRHKYDLWREMLLPHQRAAWDRFVMEDAVIRQGIFAMLANGSLGETLGLTDTQRAQIRDVSGRYSTRLVKLSRRLEVYVQTEIWQVLTPRQRTRWKAVFGPPLQRMAGAPHLWLMSPPGLLEHLTERIEQLESRRKSLDRIRKQRQ